MQFPDSLDETNRLISANREEFRIIEAKLESGNIHPRSPKHRRLEARKAILVEHTRNLIIHRADLVRLGRFSPVPTQTLREMVSAAR